MDIFKGVGDFFRGAFGGNKDDEKKRREEEARRKAAQQQNTSQQKKQELKTQLDLYRKYPNGGMMNEKSVVPNSKMGNDYHWQQGKQLALAQDAQNKKPTAPKVTPVQPVQQKKPAVDPAQYNEIKQKALGYQKPKVQDVNNYYGNDLKVLQQELSKGDKADPMRLQGLMTSLDNRTKELREFHKQRGESQSFKTARELEERVKATRGDFAEENTKLKNFWDGVSKNEKNDFIEYLNEKGVVKPKEQRAAAVNLMEAQNQPLNMGSGKWRNGTGGEFAADFSEDKKRVDEIKTRQEIADMAMSNEIKDVPLDQLGGASFAQYLDSYNKQDALQQRDTIKKLEKTLKDNEKSFTSNPELKRKTQQTMMLYQLLQDRGTKKENFGTKTQDFGDGAGAFGAALLESPGKVVQSADALARQALGRKDRGMELDDDLRAGKITPEEYNKQMNDYSRSLEWAGDGSGGRGEDALKALGTSADTVATFLPVGSVYKGARSANLTNKIILQGMKSGLTREAAEVLAKEQVKAMLQEGTKQTLKKTVAQEGASNAAFSGVGALRDGEVNAGDIAGEAVLGGTIGAVAPVVGNKTTQLWNKLRGADTALPEALEDVGRVTKQVDRRPFTEAAEDTLRATDDATNELRAIAEDASQPAFRRKEAQTAVNEADEAVRQAEFAKDPLNTPAYQVKRDIQRIIDTEEANLERYVNEHPELTPAQIEQASEAAKNRVIQLTDELKAGRAAAMGAVDEQVEAVAANADEAADVAAQVQADRVAAVTPAAGDRVQTPTGANAEDLANDAYASQYSNTFDMTDEILRQADLDPTAPTTKEGGWKRILHKATGGLISDPYKQMVDTLRDTLSDRRYQSASSTNAFRSTSSNIASLFGNNVALKDGLRQVMRIRNDAQSAAGDAVKRLHDNISDKVAKLNMEPAQFNELLDRVFESPEFLARKYGDEVKNVPVDSLPPEVRGIVDQLISANKLRNLALYRQGKISIGEYKMFEDGMHSPRLYDFEKQGLGQRGNKLIDSNATKKRKDLADISDETFEKLIESPAQRMLIRLETAMRSNASNDALRAFDEAGMLLDNAPNSQFSKLEGAKWGNYQGKYVYNPIRGQLEDTIVMNSEAGKHFNDLLDQYRDSPFGAVDRFMKKTKTVYSPGTFIGNVASNPLLFNQGAGVNAIGQSARMTKASVDLVAHRTGKAFNKDIYEAQKYGVFSSDTGKQITGENNPQLTVANNKKTNPFEAAYGGADDAAKLAIWRTLRGRGVSPELAARRVSQFTQDYNNAGRLVRSLADMPVLGKPFARFAPELARLVKNNMMYNPVGMVAGVAGIALIQKELSTQAGETDEEREARETAMGQSLIPGTGWLNKMLTGTDRDISLNFPVGDTAINIARAVGLNFPQDASGNPNMALVKSLVPFAIPTRDNAQGDAVFAPEELFTSLAWSPVAQQIANRDFMGREVDDPTNKFYYEDGSNEVRKFEGDNPDALLDRAKHGAMSYVPLANEAGAVGAAMMGEKDFYGKERTVPEAIARMFGFKTESNNQEKQKERVDTKQYFEEDLAAVQNFVKQNPDLADSYFKLKNPTRTRPVDENDPGTKVSDLVSPERWDIINTDTSGRLFNFLKEQAVKQNADDGKPLDPIFTLSPENAKYATELRSRPTGDDEEAKDILRATSDWYETFENNYFDYLDKNSKYFDSLPESKGSAKDNPRVAAYGEASEPVVMPPIIKEYMAIKKDDPDGAKQVYKANKDALSAAFDEYAVKKLDRINKLRKIEGYDPLSLETYKNKTFGFDADGGGSGFGSGGGGGGAKEVNNLGALTSFSNDISAYKPIEAQAMPNLGQLFAALQAQKSGGRAKPQLGASSRGQ